MDLMWGMYLVFCSWVCSDTVCTSFYGQVLIYGIGAPFLVVLFCSLIAPKPRQKSLTDRKDPQAYGSFETSEPVVEFVYWSMQNNPATNSRSLCWGMCLNPPHVGSITQAFNTLRARGDVIRIEKTLCWLFHLVLYSFLVFWKTGKYI